MKGHDTLREDRFFNGLEGFLSGASLTDPVGKIYFYPVAVCCLKNGGEFGEQCVIFLSGGCVDPLQCCKNLCAFVVREQCFWDCITVEQSDAAAFSGNGVDGNAASGERIDVTINGAH